MRGLRPRHRPALDLTSDPRGRRRRRRDGHETPHPAHPSRRRRRAGVQTGTRSRGTRTTGTTGRRTNGPVRTRRASRHTLRMHHDHHGRTGVVAHGVVGPGMARIRHDTPAAPSPEDHATRNLGRRSRSSLDMAARQSIELESYRIRKAPWTTASVKRRIEKKQRARPSDRGRALVAS